MGSSPLTRGKRRSITDRNPDEGLIPAHAGKTRHRSVPLAAVQGSSPLTRGKLPPREVTPRHRGLIPAHAGKTPRRRRPGTAPGAHPRSRGENRGLIENLGEAQGSSPLTRGKHILRVLEGKAEGLIPAHAGKTGRGAVPRSSGRAHPRSRGENIKSAIGGVKESGSSPLTRGKHFLTCAFIAQIGQILESRELCASSESYSLRDAYATDAPPDRVRSIGLAPRSSRGAS